MDREKKFPLPWARFTKQLAELPLVGREEAISFLQRSASIRGVEDTWKEKRIEYAVICNSVEDVADFAFLSVDYNGGSVSKFVDSARILVEEQTIIVRPGLPHLFARHSHQVGDSSAEYWFRALRFGETTFVCDDVIAGSEGLSRRRR
ncbi:MAG: hypothetical protein LAN64_19950 [Acidobacteriia bacterium]|nr:hypothetical protein [Terriglobia bacterium]